MRFKEYITEGRDKWNLFTIKKGNDKWSFRNKETGKLNYIKINKFEEIGSMQRFLQDVKATPPTFPKTKGEIDYYKFASDVVGKKQASVFIKSGKWEDIQKTWLLD